MTTETWIWISPIGLCSVVGVAYLLQAWLQLRDAARPTEAARVVRSLIEEGRLEEALRRCCAFCEGNDHGQWWLMLYKLALESRDEVLSQGCITLARMALEQPLDTVARVAKLTPLLGLLGTVVGLYQMLTVLGQSGVNSEAITQAMALALITTIAGLVVAIPLSGVQSLFLEPKKEALLGQLEQERLWVLAAVRRAV